MELLPISRAILSVTDKTGLAEFAAFLVAHKVELVSTGGTFAFLRQEGLPVIPIEEVTKFPELMGGRVKTLHPFVHAGILADKSKVEHMTALRQLSIIPFDLVCVNLYDFAGIVKTGAASREVVEHIDVGGPCMLRAAAKNYSSVLAVSSPNVYQHVMDELTVHLMHAPLALRKKMAMAAFAVTAAYDADISCYFAQLHAGADCLCSAPDSQ